MAKDEITFRCGNLFRAFLHDSITVVVCYSMLSVAAAVGVYIKLPWVCRAATAAAGYCFGIPLAAGAAAAAAVWMWGLRRLAEGYRLPASLHPTDKRPQLFRVIESILSFTSILLRLLLLGGRGTAPKKQQPENHMQGKICAVTGANSGIGQEIALQLAAWGARVAVLCRNEEEGNALAGCIHRQQQPQDTDGSICGSACTNGCVARFIKLDLCSLKSVRLAAEALKNFACSHPQTKSPKLDVLVHNAGVLRLQEVPVEEMGVGSMFATHVVGPYYLTALLWEGLLSAAGRVVFVSSLAHHYAPSSFTPQKTLLDGKRYWGHYGSSKLAESWLAAALQRSSLSSKGQEGHSQVPLIVSVHPGVVDTNLTRHIVGSSKLLSFLLSYVASLFQKTPAQGAATPLLLCAADRQTFKLGGYYAEGEEGIADFRLKDQQMQDATLAICKKLTANAS